MWRRLLSISLISVSALALSACGDGNPFDDPSAGAGSGGNGSGSGTGGNSGDGTNGGAMIDGVRPGGTGGGTTQIADGSLQRAEARDGRGGGWVDAVRANEDGTFTVIGPAFDGAGEYSVGQGLGEFNGTRQTFYVYEAEEEVPDMHNPPLNQDVQQIVPYRALYGASNNDVPATDDRPQTTFAIVRTGGYRDYGYGGFVYARNGSVALPTEPLPDSGQAVFTGDYAGIRISDREPGLHYTTGDAEVSIDFVGFGKNERNAGVSGTISNRQIYDIDGDLLYTLNQEQNIEFVIQADPQTIHSNGELSGSVTLDNLPSTPGGVDTVGTYYAVIAGDVASGGGEIVGIIVHESVGPDFNNSLVQETGGFIVYRTP